jgi:hypothetical protein
MKKYAVEIHEVETGDFIECVDKFNTEREAWECKNKIECEDDFDYENEYVDIYELEDM